MMVNEINKPAPSWQSIVPQQMPWMSTYTPTTNVGLQFGQPVESLVGPILNQTNTANPVAYKCLTQLAQDNQRTKRSSFEMELDEQVSMETPLQEEPTNKFTDVKPLRPPQKQLLTEHKLFKKFGSLHLDPNLSKAISTSDSDESDEDNNITYKDSKSTFAQGREEFQRYVYLLYKDTNSKSGNRVPLTNSLATIERLAREEREKLSKALVLWNPPIENHFNTKSSLPNTGYEGDKSNSSSDDDDDISYVDHTSFIKKSYGTDNSIIITDVSDQICCPSLPVNDEPSCIDPDDLMVD